MINELGRNGELFDLISFLYCSNVDPPIWYDTDVRLFEIQRM